MPSVTIYVDLVGVPHTFIKMDDGNGAVEHFGYGPATQNSPIGTGAVGIGLTKDFGGTSTTPAAFAPDQSSYIVTYQVSDAQFSGGEMGSDSTYL